MCFVMLTQCLVFNDFLTFTGKKQKQSNLFLTLHATLYKQLFYMDLTTLYVDVLEKKTEICNKQTTQMVHLQNKGNKRHGNHFLWPPS